MPTVRIPRSCSRRGEANYARLICRVFPRRPFWSFLEGKYFRCGAMIEREQLWPTTDYPPEPLLLEHAGNDRSGWRRQPSREIHVLWRYDLDSEEWVEIARYSSVIGQDLMEALRPLMLRHMSRVRPANPCAAPEAVSRVLQVLDYELDLLEAGDHRTFMGILYDRFISRLVEAGLR